MPVFMRRIANKRKVLKNYYTSQHHKIFDVYTLDIFGHIHTKYEVSMSNPVARRGVHRRHRTTTHDDG